MGAFSIIPGGFDLEEAEQMAADDGLAAEMQPHILAVHNHRVAALLKEKVPVILMDMIIVWE